MKVLSLHQPWAGLLMYGLKRNETRSWKPPMSLRDGEPFAIHSTVHWTKEGRDLFETLTQRWGDDIKPDTQLHTLCTTMGCILGTIELDHFKSTNDKSLRVSKFESKFGDYSPNRFVWFLRSRKLYHAPVPAKGHQGLWNWEKGGEAQ